MPIYEFYCHGCHTVFSFFSARVTTEARPACPRCGSGELPRRPSRFATLKHSGEEAELSDPFAGLDDARLEGAMESLMAEAGGLEDEQDPRAMARLMRRFSHLSGLEMGDRMEEFVARLETGEDPEALEKEVEAVGDDEDLAGFFKLKKAFHEGRRKRPEVDEELYFL
jgi:putative FmdB family regulatory protein